MAKKHLSDALFDYLFGTIDVKISGEETGQAFKMNRKSTDLKNDNEPCKTEIE